MENNRKILIVGCNSKIARLFLTEYAGRYDFFGTYARTKPDDTRSYRELYHLDLAEIGSVESFVRRIEPISFKAVLFLASTYAKDDMTLKSQFEQSQLDRQVNAISPAIIARHLQFHGALGRVFFFGDSGLQHPKLHYSSYTFSKHLLDEVVAVTAMELKDKAISIGVNLGPTLAPGGSDKAAYYSRNLINVESAALGLVRLIDFMINEPNLNMTGATIQYDGGTYLRRN